MGCLKVLGLERYCSMNISRSMVCSCPAALGSSAKAARIGLNFVGNTAVFVAVRIDCFLAGCIDHSADSVLVFQKAAEVFEGAADCTAAENFSGSGRNVAVCTVVAGRIVGFGSTLYNNKV